MPKIFSKIKKQPVDILQICNIFNV